MINAMKWLTVPTVARYCLVTPITVRRWIRYGKLSALRLPSGHYRISFADFREFLDRHNMPIKEELYEMSELETKPFEAVRHNDSGATLIELAERLDVAPIVIGRAAKYLLDAGRIRKEGSRYYLASSGTS